MGLSNEQIKERGKSPICPDRKTHKWAKNQHARSIRRESQLSLKRMIEGRVVCENCDVNCPMSCLCVNDSHPVVNRYNGWYD